MPEFPAYSYICVKRCKIYAKAHKCIELCKDFF